MILCPKRISIDKCSVSVSLSLQTDPGALKGVIFDSGRLLIIYIIRFHIPDRQSDEHEDSSIYMEHFKDCIFNDIAFRVSRERASH